MICAEQARLCLSNAGYPMRYFFELSQQHTDSILVNVFPNLSWDEPVAGCAVTCDAFIAGIIRGVKQYDPVHHYTVVVASTTFVLEPGETTLDPEVIKRYFPKQDTLLVLHVSSDGVDSLIIDDEGNTIAHDTHPASPHTDVLMSLIRP